MLFTIKIPGQLLQVVDEKRVYQDRATKEAREYQKKAASFVSGVNVILVTGRDQCVMPTQDQAMQHFEIELDSFKNDGLAVEGTAVSIKALKK